MSEDSEQKSGPSYFSQDAYTPVPKTPAAPTSDTSSEQKSAAPLFSQRNYTPARTASQHSSSTLQAPFIVPMAMLVVCFILAFVDLAFLNDVIGQVLNVEQTMSLIVSAALGLIGLAFMMHLGLQEFEHPNLGPVTKFIDYSIWLLLGVAIAATRFFAALILELDPSDEVALMNVFGTQVRQVDALFAPLMLLLYIITGLGAKRALHGLLLNRGFAQWRHETKEQKLQREKERDQAKHEIAATKKEQQQAMEAKKKELAAQKDSEQKAKHEAKQQKRAATQPFNQANAIEDMRLKEARKRHRETENAYNKQDAKFRKSTQRAAELLAKLEGIEAEASALLQRRNNMLNVITNSEKSLQQHVAMLVHTRTKAPIAELEAVIATHNSQRQDRP